MSKVEVFYLTTVPYVEEVMDMHKEVVNADVNEINFENNIRELLDRPEKFMLQAGGEYELISEMSFLRSYIKYQNYKIVIYGAGVQCEFLLRWLEMENVPIEFIIDNDPDKHNSKLGRYIIYHPKKIPEDLKNQNYLALISTAYFKKQTGEILFALFENNIKDYIYPFDPKYGLASYRFNWVSYWMKHKEEIIQIYENLPDETSKKVYFEFLKSIITNTVYRGKQQVSKKKYFEGYIPLEKEVFLNIGSYVGDTIFYFLEDRNEQFEKIYACEGDPQFCARLVENLGMLPQELREKIHIDTLYLDTENAQRYDDKEITLINMDIEGAEKEVITGLKKCIVKNRPVLAICAYHKEEDILELPLLIQELFDNYIITFRKYATVYSDRLGCAELVMYAIPEERYAKDIEK